VTCVSEVDVATGMTVFVESPRTDTGSAALAIPSSPESTTSSVAIARNKGEFNFRELCDANDICGVGLSSRVESGILSFG
jgi:hypothetical protein